MMKNERSRYTSKKIDQPDEKWWAQCDSLSSDQIWLPSFFGREFDPILYAEKFSELNPPEAE